MKIIIINGPNLNLLGKREIEIYGSQTFEDFFGSLKSEFPSHSFEYIQSNHEGVLIDTLHQFGFESDIGIILNAGGYTHTSIALRDAIASIETPVIEVHISNISERESFRHHSYMTEVCKASIIGKGLAGYKEAVRLLQTNS